MGLRSTDLPIVRACPLDAAPEGWCDHCSHRVHALSSMREHEVRALLQAHRGQKLCVAYLVRRDGTLVLAREPARAWLAPLLATATACWGPEDGATIRPQDAAWADAQAGCGPVPRLRDKPVADPPNVTRVDFEMPD